MSNPAVTVPLRTVTGPVRWEGPGLHTGSPCTVTVHPAGEPGLRFNVGGTEIPALAEYVTDTRRCTALGRDGASVATVEHLLAALAGLGVWAAKIEVDGPEIPILDGSARPFVEQLLATGFRETGEIEALVPGEGEISENGVVRRWTPEPLRPSASFLLTGDHPLLSGQRADLALDDPEAFADEVPGCRTWSPIEQVRPLLDQGLIRGGSLENAIVVYPDRYSSDLRCEREPARHKLRDLVGDLALVGVPVRAAITAAGGGHAHNVRLAQTLRSSL
jgi:UDP-3-O-[3-hydroxymyristoyl] N-acetylglucosamine deacetylase